MRFLTGTNDMLSKPTEDATKTVKILIGALGYEKRSCQFLLSETLTEFDAILIYDYQAVGMHSYDANLKIVNEMQLDDNKLSDPNLFINEFNRRCLEYSGNKISVTIDFSSLDRSLISELLLAVYRNRGIIIDVNVLYFPQVFSKPFNVLDTVSKFGPVLPEFSGSSRSSDQKLCMIVGSGYEFGKVIGAQDRLEPDEIFVFTPVGTDPRFEDAIRNANYGFEFIENSNNVVKYDLSSPEETLASLFELVRHKKATHRVLLLPMGPKIFAVFSLIIAIRFHPDVRVWHYSTHRNNASTTSDAFASGQKVCLNLSTTAMFGSANS